MDRRTQIAALLAAIAGLWRLFLMSRYYGWEESDYGNLMMSHGVLVSGFTDFDKDHLPMYYALSAAVMAVVGDAVVATRLVCWGSGVLSVGLLAWLADALGGRRLALLVGVYAIFEPELALYSASSLREPTYGLGVVACLFFLAREQLALASFAAGFAFLTRMDAMLTLGPVLALHALGAPGRPLRLLRALAPLAAAIVAWSVYCEVRHGTWQFWGHSVNVNIETGGIQASGAQRIADGLSVSAGMLFDMATSHMGWFPVLAWLGGLALVGWRRHGGERSVAAASVTLAGFWLGIGFIAQHEPHHNLYWKWMYPVVPGMVLVGGLGALRLVDRLPWSAWIFGAFGLQSAWAMALETQRQLDLSERLYKPQLELAKWIEAEIPEDVPLVLDNIPACWIDRRHNNRTLISWFDIPPQSPEDFGRWIDENHIGGVLWFKEEWTQAPVAAPWLAPGVELRAGPVRLVPTRSEPEYGWIWYEVER